MAYREFPLDTDTDEIVDQALARIGELIPGWEPREGHLEVIVLEEMARMVLENADTARRVADDVFADFGRELVGIAQLAGAAATGEATFTALDDSGYTVQAGWRLLVAVTGDDDVEFMVSADTEIPSGNVSVDAPIEAVTDGEHANGFTADDPVTLEETVDWVDDVTLAGETSGGIDSESDDAYRDRLADRLQLLSRTPIVPRDFATMTLEIAGVARTVGIDGYNPDDGTLDNERMVAVACVDSDGLPVDQATKDEVADLLERRREVTFVAHVIDPTYTAVEVSFSIAVDDDADADEVLEAARQAVRDHLDPASWAGGDEDPPDWRPDQTVVRYLRLAHVIHQVAGVRYVDELTLNGGTSDLVLVGPAPLPAPFDDVAAVTPTSSVTGTTV